MKTIIAGSRSITSFAEACAAIEGCGWRISEVVSGAARGVDRLGERWASQTGVPVIRFPAQWDIHGKRAGVYRNQAMAEYADALIAIWDGQSNGTKHMIDAASKRGLRVHVVVCASGPVHSA